MIHTIKHAKSTKNKRKTQSRFFLSFQCFKNICFVFENLFENLSFLRCRKRPILGTFSVELRGIEPRERTRKASVYKAFSVFVLRTLRTFLRTFSKIHNKFYFFCYLLYALVIIIIILLCCVNFRVS